MADTVERTETRHVAGLTLNSDGQAHTLLNAACIFTFVIGLVSMALGMYLRYGSSSFGVALAAGLTGLAGLIVGLVTQMFTATREQRIINVVGMVAAFIGLAMGLGHGGFS
jgi:FtsH-binding integral membrane protein